MRAPGVDAELSKVTNGSSFYYLRDALNSVRNLIDGAQSIQNIYDYDAWGDILAQVENVANDRKFTGREADRESGLYYYRARMYDPSIARFTQREPVDPNLGRSPYAYVDNDPVNRVDPLGLWGFWSAVGAIALGVAVVALAVVAAPLVIAAAVAVAETVGPAVVAAGSAVGSLALRGGLIIATTVAPIVPTVTRAAVPLAQAGQKVIQAVGTVITKRREIEEAVEIAREAANKVPGNILPLIGLGILGIGEAGSTEAPGGNNALEVMNAASSPARALLPKRRSRLRWGWAVRSLSH